MDLLCYFPALFEILKFLNRLKLEKEKREIISLRKKIKLSFFSFFSPVRKKMLVEKTSLSFYSVNCIFEFFNIGFLGLGANLI